MLVNADLLPPHVMLVVEGCYYSLGVNGVRIAEPIDGLMRMLLGRNKMVVFVELTFKSLEGIAVELQKAFEPVCAIGGFGDLDLGAIDRGDVDRGDVDLNPMSLDLSALEMGYSKANAKTKTKAKADGEGEGDGEGGISIRTCLSPIRAFFEKHFNWQLSAVSTVFQLLNQLYESNLIEEVFVLNNKLPIEQDGVLTLPKYDLQTIQQHIQNLKLKQNAS